MNRTWPPLDTHAHIKTSIDPGDLLALRAVIFAATRTLDEFKSTLARTDPVAVWGVGAHPGAKDAMDSFSTNEFKRLAQNTPLVSEVGLDGKSATPMSKQQDVLHAILEALREQPRIISIHSAGATAEIIEILEAHRPAGVVLHWWRGTPEETAKAIELGCRFSVNERERRKPAVVGLASVDRILTETDHPFTGGARAVPGELDAIERFIGRQTRLPHAEVRKTVWANLASLADETGTTSLFPTRIRNMLSTIRSA